MEIKQTIPNSIELGNASELTLGYRNGTFIEATRATLLWDKNNKPN